MARGALITMVVLIAAGGLAWGASAWRHASNCSALENRFLNAVAKNKSAGTISQLGTPDVLKLTGRLQREADIESDRMITLIATDCGDDAAQTAIRKGYQLISA